MLVECTLKSKNLWYLHSGRRGRWCESSHLDHRKDRRFLSTVFLYACIHADLQFESAINSLAKKDNALFTRKCSERTICGALMLQLDKKIKFTPFSGYYSNVEYN